MSDAASDGLAGVPPGPELAARLARIDPHEVPDEQLGELAKAQYRQLAHQQAEFWQAIDEIARRDPMPNLPGGARWSAREVFENAVDELRAELVLTRRAAETELASAVGVAGMPRVMQALSDGAIDRARAIRFAEGCTDLTGEQTEVLLDELLPAAAEVSATELADKIKRTAIALDPEWARRRYTQAIKEQKVVGYLNADGSAVVSGQNLPAEEAALACARVDALADAAKRAGAKARIDTLRATVFTGLLNGRFHDLTREAITAELARQFRTPTPDTTDAEPTEQAPGAAGSPTEPAPKAAAAAEPATPEPVAGVHLRIGLATLLGLDQQPGEIAGMGTIPAPVARALAGRQRRGEWRYAILDQAGRLLFDGITRRRPHDRDARSRVRVRGGIVELHVPLTLLTDPEIALRYPEWAGLLADLAKQYEVQAPIEQDPTARFAGRPLRRRQQTRFQHCTFRGCRRPASDCDLDHRREHTHGGPTEPGNLDPDCRHHHDLKTNRGWHVVRRDQHTYLWISPLGRKHIVTIDPIAPPLPQPIPRPLPPERDHPDTTDPRPSFQPLDQHERALPSAAPPKPVAIIDTNSDPPPF